ncbi:hypothetical protein ACHAXT_001653 [Thalassiosira profunda]
MGFRAAEEARRHASLVKSTARYYIRGSWQMQSRQTPPPRGPIATMDDGGTRDAAEAPPMMISVPLSGGAANGGDGSEPSKSHHASPNNIEPNAPAAAMVTPDPTAASKYRSGWSSTPRMPAQTALHLDRAVELDDELDAIRIAKRKLAERNEEIAQKEAEAKAAEEAKERERKEAEVQESISHSLEVGLSRTEAEFERVKQERLAKVRVQQIEHERVREQERAEAKLQDRTMDESLEEGRPPSEEDAVQQLREKIDGRSEPWHKQKKYRCGILLIVLLVVAIIGLAAGLAGKNSGSDGGASSAEDFVWVEGEEIPLVVDRTCQYELRRTMQLGVTDNNIDSKFWGSASDFDGTDAVIVSHSREGGGAVWALSENAEGSWGQSAFQSSWSDQSGWDVAVRNGIIVIGTPAYQGRDVEHWENDSSWWGGRGAAVVLARDEGGNWKEQALLVPSEADDIAGFGNSVAISESGRRIAVGAWHDRENRGSVYIFEKIRGMWAETQKLAPLTARSQSVTFHGNYGSSVAITDTSLAVLAPHDYGDGRLRGVVYVYSRGRDGQYEEAQQLGLGLGEQLKVTSGAGLAFLGSDWLAAGAGENRKVHMFRSSSSGYQKTTELTSSDAGGNSIFGVGLDGQGNQVMVQDCGEDAAYLFSFEGGVWKEKAKFNGCNTSMSGNSMVSQSNEDFALTGSLYGGPVRFYDLVCERDR